MNTIKLYLFLVSSISLNTSAFSEAHCWCVLGSSNAPLHDFGAIATYKIQPGHAAQCKSTCAATVNSFLGNAVNNAATCSASGGNAVSSHSKVGGAAYAFVQSNPCLTGTGPSGPAGQLAFSNLPPLGNANSGVVADNSAFAGPNTTLPPNGLGYTVFSQYALISTNFSKHTYTATLYRNGTVVDVKSGIAPLMQFKGIVARVTFAGQPNNFVNNALWRVDWILQGAGGTSGSAETIIHK